MPALCPEGHPSTAPDFCSVCGTEMRKAAAPASAAAPGACPDCDTPRETTLQVYCEICGYNFRSGVSGQGKAVVKVVPRSPRPEAPAVAPPAAAPAVSGPSVRWDVVVTVDANLYGTPNADAPTDQPCQTFTLFERENLIGRGGSDIHPEVLIVHDAGVSRRQALLLRQPDGGLMLRDLNSVNGTQLNGKELVPGADVPVQDGDTIAVGAWTRLSIRAVVR